MGDIRVHDTRQAEALAARRERLPSPVGRGELPLVLPRRRAGAGAAEAPARSSTPGTAGGEAPTQEARRGTRAVDEQRLAMLVYRMMKRDLLLGRERRAL